MSQGMTSGALVKSALTLIGALSVAETPSANEMVDGLADLNDLLEVWSLQNLALAGTSTQAFQTVAGKATYTIGPAGDWPTIRPIRINDPAMCNFGGVDFPVRLIGQENYSVIGLKTQQQPIIEKLLYVNDSPLGIVTLWPVPSSIVTMTLSIDRVLAVVPDAFTPMLFPPGYLLAMRYQLGILMAPEYGISIPPEIQGVALTSFAAIKRANKTRRTSSFDGGLVEAGPIIWQTGV